MPPATHTANPPWLDLVRRKVEGLHYGQVHIVIHDHQVTQVECLERTRLTPTRPSHPRDGRDDRSE